MTTTPNGNPCWYELTSYNPDAAQAFYAAVLGWKVTNAGMEGADYRLAAAGDDMVAGIWVPEAQGMPPFWMVYFTTGNCDTAIEAVTKAGGKVHMEPNDVPGTGRFAVVQDPQGAVFGLLQPLDSKGNAFDQKKTGHGNWHELMTTDPKEAFAFYSELFGWKAGTSMDMGAMGRYDIFSHQGTDIGGMMRLAPDMPGPGTPFWLPYFGIESIDAAAKRVTASGGKVVSGPQDVPGGAFIVVASDPQGSIFALVGPR
ncbi:VOC family protein [Phaeovulum sp.]|uniref:VOC family protein n=1 Tax=Phaeovulum sp. TaxID=2934796 RepID=UPI0035668F29